VVEPDRGAAERGKRDDLAVGLLIPFVAIRLGALLIPPVIAAMRRTAVDAGLQPEDEQTGVPSTSEASYEPVQQPRQP
jgi:hypothetical protein